MTFADQSGQTYSLDEVLKLKDEDWFSRGVALSRPCNQHIVDSSLEKLEELRQSGTHHQLIAVACSINHAREIRSLYQERGYNADVIHSNQTADEQEEILNALRNGTLDCIIQVQMLAEGFDHQKLSVAAIFRPFRSLAPYIQFVGRIMRVIVGNDPTHPDNMGHIVTHLGMNLDERLREFEEFESDDQAFWNKVIGGADPEVPKPTREGSTRLTAEERVVVRGEIVDSLWEEDFTRLDDQEILEDLREHMKLLGLDPSKAEEAIRAGQKPPVQVRKPSEPFLVQPQREWEESKKRLNEQAKRLAKLLLNHVGLEMNGIELSRKYTSLRLTGRNNFVSAVMMVNAELRKRLGKDREEASTEEFKDVLANLDDLLQTLVRRVKKAISEYDKAQT